MLGVGEILRVGARDEPVRNVEITVPIVIEIPGIAGPGPAAQSDLSGAGGIGETRAGVRANGGKPSGAGAAPDADAGGDRRGE